MCTTPLSAFRFRAYVHTQRRTYACTYTRMQPTFHLCVVATTEFAVAVYRRPTYTHACTRVRILSFNRPRERRELPGTDTTTANIEFALTSREHVGRSIRLVWYPRNFTGGYEGKLDARRRLFSRTRAAFYLPAV